MRPNKVKKGEINNLNFNKIRQNYFVENGSALKINNKNYGKYSSSEATLNF